ncbi:MAG: UDP-N-acetylmuramate dehydrogenase [Saprospirales bacterium]|jgi:UDP-N-acetylmuramate dehydrogenase|nr:UDP-N-acetylmuramate dehydrogenase [Saprospirales bacterium]MBK8923055.1 UDP-N-acetylmuramate dehydrogenase [Saprospirales bacterium]
MQPSSNISLLPYNTFGLPAKAAHFVEIQSVEELQLALQWGFEPVLILGGGSNILFTRDWPGLVVRNTIRGIEVVRRFKRRVWVRAGGGTVWHDFVRWAVQHSFGGVENLSLIPGSVGAAPVQNIGAYGVELKDIFVALEAVELASGRRRRFGRAECRFGYRDSIFKQAEKGRYCITSVTFSLSLAGHRLNTAYGDLQKTLASMGISAPTIADVSEAVVRIRSSKLPDPAVTGNCGSFFKNPEVTRPVLTNIQRTHPAVPHFDLPDGRVKIPAGWLIEQCGWKGKRVGNTGCYEKQALVLVNHGGATGAEVQALAWAIIAAVERQFGIRLEAEVNIL